MAFPSVYEMTNPLTTVRKQHFWDYFSGATLNSRWTFTNHLGAGSGAMSDSVDGGYIVTTASATNNRSGISFNDIRPFAHDGSVMIASVKRNTASSFIYTGLSESSDSAGSDANSISCENDTSDTFIQLYNKGTGSALTTVTDVPIHTNYTDVKIELLSSSATMSLDGVLKADITSFLPTVALQPNFLVLRRSSGNATGNIKYMECYNT